MTDSLLVHNLQENISLLQTVFAVTKAVVCSDRDVSIQRGQNKQTNKHSCAENFLVADGLFPSCCKW